MVEPQRTEALILFMSSVLYTIAVDLTASMRKLATEINVDTKKVRTVVEMEMLRGPMSRPRSISGQFP